MPPQSLRTTSLEEGESDVCRGRGQLLRVRKELPHQNFLPNSPSPAPNVCTGAELRVPSLYAPNVHPVACFHSVESMAIGRKPYAWKASFEKRRVSLHWKGGPSGRSRARGGGAPGTGGTHKGGRAFQFPLGGLERVRRSGSGGDLNRMKVELAILRRG